MIVTFMVFSACVAQNKPLVTGKASQIDGGNAYFGSHFTDTDVLNSAKMLGNYEKMSTKDTVSSKFSALVTEVCKVKGCWMKLQLGKGKETMVRFKDYGFFVPKELVGKEVIVNGLAFVEEMNVKDQRHYARDAGKTEEEIAGITNMEKKYAFEADGVLIKE